jgi:hypothetical protein
VSWCGGKPVPAAGGLAAHAWSERLDGVDVAKSSLPEQ